MFSAGAPSPVPGPTGPNARPHLPLDEPPPGWPTSIPPHAEHHRVALVLLGVALLAPTSFVALAFAGAAFVLVATPARNLPRRPRMSEHDDHYSDQRGEHDAGPTLLRDADRAAADTGDADYDFDAFLEQKAEATGKAADESSFKHLGQRWTFTNPSYADQDWSDELERLENDEDSDVYDLAAHYMGTEQLDRYLDAGGTAMNATVAVGRAVQAEARKSTAVNANRPTRRGRSSRKGRKK